MSVEVGPISVQVISPPQVMDGPRPGVQSPGFPLFGNESVMVAELPAEFRPGGIYAPENMPLADSIPLERNPDPGKKTTAAHELQHVVVGKAKGNSLVAMSVNPEGARLGWTLFEGAVDPATAAAGSIDTVFGPASGFGGDFATIMYLDWIHDRVPGSSISSAQSEAQAIISGFDPVFLTIASEIIALKGFLNAEDFEEVCRRAEFELVWNRSGFDLKEALALQGIDVVKDYKDDQLDKGKLVIPNSGTVTLIETFEGQVVTTIFVDGKIKSQTVICPGCGVEGGGHLPGCEFVKGDLVESPSNHTEFAVFPDKAIIYSY